MKLIYQLTPSDLVAFDVYHAAHSELTRKQRRNYRIVLTTIYLTIAALFFAIDRRIASALVAAFAIIWFLSYPQRTERRSRIYFQRFIAETVGDSLKEAVILELHDDGIHSTSYLGQSTIKYSAVDKLVVDGIYTYVYIGRGAALIFPDDRIPRDQINAFVEEIKTRKESADRPIQSSGDPLREPPISDS